MGGTDAPTAGPSLAGRFAAAIALTVGFYLLALAIAGALLAVAILPWVFGGPGNLWISLTGLVLGVTILVAIVPRRRRRRAGADRRRAPSTRGPRALLAGLLGRRQLVCAAGGTSSGTDGGGTSVWIPLTSGSSTRLVLSGRVPPGSRNNCHSTSDHPLSLVNPE